MRTFDGHSGHLYFLIHVLHRFLRHLLHRDSSGSREVEHPRLGAADGGNVRPARSVNQ